MTTVDTVQTGQNIKTIIRQKGMKIADIQSAFGFNTPQAIYKWFRGDSMPTIDNIVMMTEIFGVRMDEIVAVKKTA
ncbi:MAG: helix-turn-helix transcriptional regulator [Lachnospiraceae bacterium]|nr:helix-turn-helix transcriptional regulator [Lachnospiraceae bacterium]MBR3736802.1 helix-turn-helix transcriptional regulator [Lachnospiraceae bacterium]MBR6849224.1 helix-turn-helix transcriptional regulator [Lachnospiraceae bacterium]